MSCNESKPFRIHFKPGRNYSIFIHDPNYYIFTFNPETIPKIEIMIEDSRSAFIYVKAVYHHNMDRPEQHCIASESYSFSRCVADYVSKIAGCRYELDIFSSRYLPVCRTVEQILQIEQEYLKTWTMTQARLMNHTGCYPPCHYTQYQLASQPSRYQFQDQKFSLLFSSSTVLERTEEMLFPMASFVSEFGGALGLFLGFSFATVWDEVEGFIKYCLKQQKK